MNNKILLVFISFLSMAACKKNAATVDTGSVNVIPASSVPVAVINSFNANFSSSTGIEWQHNSDDSFICQFNMDDQRHEAHFDDSGHQSRHLVICIDAAVPDLVLQAFRDGFPSDQIFEWNLTNEGTWKAHFMRGLIKWEVTFNNAGTVIKSEHD